MDQEFNFEINADNQRYENCKSVKDLNFEND